MKNPKENIIQVFEDVDNILKCEKTDWYCISGNGQKNWNSEKIKEFNFAIDFQIKDTKTIKFSGYTFPEFRFNNIILKDKDLTFENCKFEGLFYLDKLNIKSLIFENCKFNDNISIDTNIEELNITNNIFNGEFSISSKNKIIDKMILIKNHFIGDFIIENTQINLGYFEKNIFSGNDNKFLNIIFGGAEFKDIEFNNFIFENIRCDNDLIYFSKNISFNSNVIFRRVKLDWISFLGANIENISFDYRNEDWLNINGRKVLFDEWIIYNYKRYYKEDDIIDLTNQFILNKYLLFNIDDIKYHNFMKIENLYCQLKSNFENKKIWQVAGEFHIGEMEMKYKSLSLFSNKIIDKFVLGFYKFFSIYGESIGENIKGILYLFLFSALFIFIFQNSTDFKLFGNSISDVLLTIFRVIILQKETWFSELSTSVKVIITIIQLLSPILLFLLALAIKRKIKR